MISEGINLDIKSHKTSRQYMPLDAFDEYIEERLNLAGKRIVKAICRRYCYLSRIRLSEFLSEKHHLSDIPLREINYQFIHDFEMYLLTVRGNKQNTIARYLIILKKIVELAYKNEWVFRNPFINYKIEDKKSERGLSYSKRSRNSNELETG